MLLFITFCNDSFYTSPDTFARLKITQAYYKGIKSFSFFAKFMNFNAIICDFYCIFAISYWQTI